MRSKIILTLTSIFLWGIVFAQEQDISGTVTDSQGVPLPGVNVFIEDSDVGTYTDFDGNYSITAEMGKTLVFSVIGFEDQKVTVGSETVVNVQMEEGQALDEVVVIGYGTQKAKDVSTAITSVSAADFNQGVMSNPIEQVSGKVPGLVITQPSGDPNENVSIRLRGQASLTGGQSPLIVLDGVPLDDPNIISNIPSEDIASFNVLKDAAATAVYGSRGANGVIIMNTKEGRRGKTEITYSGKIGFSELAKRYDFLNAQEWKDASRRFGADDATLQGLDKGGDTDWMKALTRTAATHSHNLGISGGGEDFTFFGSVTYTEQEGIVVNTGREQLGIHFNAEKKAFDDKLSIRMGIINTDTKREYVDGSIFPASQNSLPVYPVYNDDGSYFAFHDFEQFNAVMHQEEQLNRGKEHLSVLHGGVDYKLDDLLDGLSVGVTGSISRFTKDTDWFKPQFPVENNFNSARKGTEHRESKKGDIHINYSQDWDAHHFDATLVHEYSDFTHDYFNAEGREYLVEENQNNSLQNGNPQFNLIDSYKDRYNLSSFLARFSYNYDGKYYLNASYRRDGSSKFGVNNRWGNFPAFSVAWRLSQENFLSEVDWINDLKLRGGYGVTGNQDAIDAYRTQRLLGSLGRFYNGATDSYPLSYGPEQNDNPDLRWEEVHGLNIGLDFSLLSRRLTGDINWFHNKTKNLLFTYRVPVPPFYVNDILANVGSMVNKGVELSLSGDIIDTGDFTWSVDGQITVIDTKITNLSGTYSGFDLSTDNVEGGVAEGRGLSNFPITYLKKGYAPFVFYLPHYIGTDANGNQVFSDGQGGEVLQGDLNPDMYNYYDPSPDFTYGIGSNFGYKNWGLNFFLRGVSGQKIFNNSRLNIDNVTRLPGNNVTRTGLNSGIEDGPAVSDLWLEKAGFLRMDNITLSYTFRDIPQISSLRLSATANNLFVITDYKGLDPEIRIADTNQAYIDANKGDTGYYPKDRTFMLGVNIAF